MNRIPLRMRMKRKKSFSIETVDQMKILSSAIPYGILQTLKRKGPMSANELGPLLGRKPNSLHYHIRNLVKLGMIKQVDERQSGARTEAVYDAVADRYIGANLGKDPAFQREANKGVLTLVRQAGRNFVRAIENQDNIFEKGGKRNLAARQYMTRLNDDQLTELNDYIKKIENLFIESVGKEEGRMYSLTMLLSPIATEDEKK